MLTLLKIENRGAGPCAVFYDDAHAREVVFNEPSLKLRIANLKMQGLSTEAEEDALDALKASASKFPGVDIDAVHRLTKGVP